jgi:hypothetical protein
MIFARHRVNTIDDLMKTPLEFGVEVDLRDNGEDIVVAHDPFCNGERFSDYILHYNHAFIILNVKSERIEWRILDILERHGISDYFFLDCSFPMTVTLTRFGCKKVALRFSEYEGLETIEKMKTQIEWVWVDCFNKYPIDATTYNLLREWSLKLCIVSPELQARQEEVEAFQDEILLLRHTPDMVCSKFENRLTWLKKFN